MKHSLVMLAGILLVSCGSPAPAPTPKPTTKPRAQFQKLIYDNGMFAVMRDRGTGCQWIGLLSNDHNIVDITPRTRMIASGRTEQICTRDGDPLSMPLKVEGTGSLFRLTHTTELTDMADIRTYRDIETGCEWLVLKSYDMDHTTWALRQRTGNGEDGVQQVCRPVRGENDETDVL